MIQTTCTILVLRYQENDKKKIFLYPQNNTESKELMPDHKHWSLLNNMTTKLLCVKILALTGWTNPAVN